MTTLGQRIREHRRRAGLSQEALARRMDVSRQAVTKWESGQSAPSTENLFRLAELFGTTVDLLLPSKGADAPAAEAPPPLWSRIRWRPRVLAALAVTAGYLVFYLLGRILWCPLEDSSLLGWLLWERPSGGESYLYGWLLSSGLFWWAMALSALTALLGWYRLSCTTCAYFLIGFLMGLVLGPHPPGAAMGHGHYGWAFWGCIYLLSLPMGLLAERAGRKGVTFASRRRRDWSCARSCPPFWRRWQKRPEICKKSPERMHTLHPLRTPFYGRTARYSSNQSSTTSRAATGVTLPRISLDSSDRIPDCEAVIPGISVRSPPLSTRMP